VLKEHKVPEETKVMWACKVKKVILEPQANKDPLGPRATVALRDFKDLQGSREIRDYRDPLVRKVRKEIRDLQVLKASPAQRAILALKDRKGSLDPKETPVRKDSRA
jgi:hypothetical protein